ncbi:inositol polyphosphate 5-phosphatase [Aureococcus anophagefferens]|uniref:Inositol polyphosphate 5-phosphatase n=1 Tax=Aureococcus anophagefferens TaxID=44056 RepID=A0ABR1FQL5_AURAN
MGTLLEQFVFTAGDGSEMVVTVVEDAEAGQRFVHGKELASGREHRVALDPSLSLAAVSASLFATAAPAALRAALLPLDRYHLVHVGTQECERSIAASLLVQSKAAWTATLVAALGPNYEVVASHTLQATHAILFCHRSARPLLGDVRSGAVATGLGAGDTRLGNKGGVGLALDVGGARVCFVASHLTAHQKKSAERNPVRNREFHKISAELAKLLAPGAPPPDDGADPLRGAFDVVAWSGDLNYRVDLPRDAADDLIAARDFAGLLAADQLAGALASGAAWAGYAEAPVAFPPTYKFDAAADGALDVYDTSPKRRVPSYTDRVLVASRDAAAARIVDYGSVADLRSSDHRPVAATLSLAVDAATAKEATLGQHQSQVCAVM